jgi:hypothetical protein
VGPTSRCTYGFTGHVTKAYVSDSNQIMVANWSVYGDFSPTLYKCVCYVYVCICMYVYIYIYIYSPVISRMLLYRRLKLDLTNTTDFLRKDPPHKSFILKIKPSVGLLPKISMPLYKCTEYSLK